MSRALKAAAPRGTPTLSFPQSAPSLTEIQNLPIKLPALLPQITPESQGEKLICHKCPTLKILIQLTAKCGTLEIMTPADYTAILLVMC